MTADAILKQFQKLPFAEAERLMPRLLASKVRKRPGSPGTKESRLLAKITAGAPAPMLRTSQELILKRRASGLTPAEEQRLHRCTAALESFNVQWLGWVAELAALRGVSVRALMKQLDLPRPDYV
jgi:hypothetical protein